MGTLLLIAVGIFIGWLLFRPKQDTGKREGRPDLSAKDDHRQTDVTMRHVSAAQSQTVLRNGKDHTLRNVAGGVVAGAVLGHMLSGDKKHVHQETTNNYNTYQDFHAYGEYDDEDDFRFAEDEGESDDADDTEYAAAYDLDYDDSDDSGDDDSGWNDSYDDDDY
ncbi:hypothetical protein SAMN02910356_00315 [Selenomonas sp. GACV-9]|uniref:hypothetical protein n=1 Tax=Selenomonas sp. GACV-9 TaxID=3158782 RepID=UPI0008E5D61E|nr:hypothetical protein SAMN02910356_00315 [Selenomonas ruminantium]